MSTREKIRKFLDEGLEPQEIADKVGVKRQTVYHYRYLFNKEGKSNKVEENSNQDETQRKEERKMKKLERENKTLKAELRDSEKELKQEQEQHKLLLSKYKELEKDSVANAEKGSKNNELSKDYVLRMQERVEALIHENSAAQHMMETLQEDKDKLTETLYKREQHIAELRDELEAEREKHKYLRSYSMLIMQEEGAANV